MDDDVDPGVYVIGKNRYIDLVITLRSKVLQTYIRETKSYKTRGVLLCTTYEHFLTSLEMKQQQMKGKVPVPLTTEEMIAMRIAKRLPVHKRQKLYARFQPTKSVRRFGITDAGAELVRKGTVRDIFLLVMIGAQDVALLRFVDGLSVLDESRFPTEESMNNFLSASVLDLSKEGVN